jgi:ubiquinone/menaquinone biosynthesis C-methylase UbiE
LKRRCIRFSGKKVLDIGCGAGGYASKFVDEGADVIALDITPQYYQHIRGAKFIVGDAAELPFKNASFDFIYCSSLIEHVREPSALIKELHRTLKKRGILYLSFPPFWSPVGSHQFKPFHYLGEWAAVRLSRMLYGVKSYHYDDAYGKLHIRTIRQVKRLVKEQGFSIISISTRMFPINTAKIPLLNEILAWHAEFLLKK